MYKAMIYLLIIALMAAIMLPYVKVEAGDASVQMSHTEIVITVGDTMEISLLQFKLPLKGGSKIKWTSSKSFVAVVKDGLVTAKSPGESVITATIQSGAKARKAICKVTVVKQKSEIATPVTIKSSIHIQKGDGYEVSIFYPKLSIKKNKTAAKKINRFFKNEMNKRKKEAASLPKNMSDSVTYSLDTNYEVAYHEGNLISILVNTNSYTGGAHGNYATAAYAFDLSTGEAAQGKDAFDETGYLTDEGIRLLLPGSKTIHTAFGGNAGTGYEWSCKTDVKDVLKLKETKITSEYGNLPEPPSGGAQTTSFTFEAAKKTGRVTLTFEYKRSWEKEEPLKTEVFHYYVDALGLIYEISADSK